MDLHPNLAKQLIDGLLYSRPFGLDVSPDTAWWLNATALVFILSMAVRWVNKVSRAVDKVKGKL